jgi:Mrp family chromosome partitioning ATPase
MLALTESPFAYACNAALAAWQSRRERRVRCERDLVAAIGEPLVAARPASAQALDALAAALLEHWFGAAVLLPVVSAASGDGRSRVAAELALRFAALGQRTLLVDADLRSPSLHRRFGLANEAGLADLLEGRDVRLSACRENLALLVSGRMREDPLELLSRDRLRHFFAAATRPFHVVLVDTPAANRGPDFQMFTALARGALLVVRRGEDRARLARLRRQLTRCAARPVAALFSRN